MARSFRPVALAAARAAEEKKGGEITLLHVTRTSPITDYLLIVTALSGTHLEALEDEVRKAAQGLHCPCLRRARPQSNRWRVLDFGGLLVHLMTAETREFYALDKLYHDAPKIKWSPNHDHPRKKAGAPRPRA